VRATLPLSAFDVDAATPAPGNRLAQAQISQDSE